MSKPLSGAATLRAMRKWNVPIRGVDGWTSRGRPNGRFDDLRGIIVHHTGSDTPSPAKYAAGILTAGRSDLPGPLCHSSTAADGTVYLVAAGRANHAGLGSGSVLASVERDAIPLTSTVRPGSDTADGNAHFYGTETQFSGAHAMSRPQYRSLVRWLAAICDAHGWTGRSIIGHKEWTSRKPDPGSTDMAALRRDVNAELRAGPAVRWDLDLIDRIVRVKTRTKVLDRSGGRGTRTKGYVAAGSRQRLTGRTRSFLGRARVERHIKDGKTDWLYSPNFED